MSQKTQIITKNAYKYFYFQFFKSPTVRTNFDCGRPEYKELQQQQ